MTAPTAGAATRAFASRFSTNAQGDVTFVANTLMKCTPSTNCTNALVGTASGANNNNNNHSMIYVDTDADASTFNSSSANLALPVGASVLFARLYWGGVSGNAARNQVKFMAAGATNYANLVSTQLDNNGNDYQGSVDVTAAVQAAGVGSYTVANVQSTQAGGTYAGWSMVVAYADPNGVMRNLTVFDGYQVVSSAPVSIPVSGFLTPPVGPVNTKIGVVAYEGDLGTQGDQLSLNGTVLGDARNPTNNFFNSSISDPNGSVTARNPNNINTMGFDADIIQVANPGNAVLANGATSATIRLSTTGDFYYPGVVSFVTDLYAPKMKVDKAYTDVNGGQPRPGDELEYTLTISNTGKDPAINTVLTDAIPLNTSYVANSLSIVSGANSGAKSDTVGDDQAHFASNEVRFFLGAGATGTAGGQMNENDVTVVKFRVRISPTAPDNVPIPNTASLTFTALTLGSTSITPSVVVPVVIANRADLSITKSDGASSEVPGTSVQYTIVVSNSAASTNLISNAIVTDALPANLTSATWTCSPSAGSTCDAGSGSGSISTTVDLAVNGTATFIVDATVVASATGSLSNTASVTAPAGVTDADPSNNSATDTDTLTPRGDLSITKTDSVATAVPGAPLTYRVVVANSGPSAASGVAVTDAPPAVSGTVNWTCTASSGSSCPASGTGDLSTSVDVASGGSATFDITYVVDAATTGSLVNTATLRVPTGFSDAAAGNNSATDTDTLVPNAALSITKSHSPAVIVAGTTTTYTISVVNAGPSIAATASILDTLPAGFTVASVASSVWACGTPAATLSCNATNLAVGTSTVTVIGEFAEGATGIATNTAEVSSPSDANTADNTATDTSTLQSRADLAITKSHLPLDAVAGAPLTYVLDVVNLGPSTALDVKIEDVLPAELTFVSATGTGWSCANPSGQNVSCSIASLPVGSTSVQIQTTVAAAATGTLSNTAEVSAQTADPAAGNNVSTDSTPIVVQADLEITKVHVGPFIAGSPIQWKIVASNRGPSDVVGATISDTPPAVVTGVSWTCAGQLGATCSTPAGVGAPSGVPISLPSGSSVTMFLNGTLDPLNGSATVVNTATLGIPSGVVDPNLSNNSGSDSTAAVSRADLSVTKTNGQASVVPGTSTTYTIVVENAGPTAVSGATVTDTFPVGLSGATWTCVGSAGGVCSSGPTGTASINHTVNLAAGGRVTYIVSGIVNPSATGTLVNTAAVAVPTGPGSPTDPDLSNNSATDSEPIQPVIDLAIAKTAPPTFVAGSGTISYVIEVTNAGPSDAPLVAVTDTLPASLVPSASWTCSGATGAACSTPSGSGVAGMNGSVPVGGTLTFTVTATVGESVVGTLTNTASVAALGAGSGDEPNLANNEASVSTEVVRVVDVSIEKDDLVTQVVAGQNTTYSISVKNTGPSAISGVRMFDALPAKASGATWTCTATLGSSCASATGSGSIDELLALASNGVVTFTVVTSVRPEARGTMTNTASLELPSGVTDTNPNNHQDNDTDTIVALGALTITKISSADPGPVSSGQTLTYTIRVANAGPSAMVDAAITDAVPAGLIGVTWTCAPVGVAVNPTRCTASGNGSLLTTVSLAPTAIVEFVVSGTVNPTARGSLVNTATATLPTDVDPVVSGSPRSVSATNTLAIAPTTNLKISKTDGVTDAVPGEAVTYTIVVTNEGPAAVTNALVTDNPTTAFPNGTWSCEAGAGSACSTGGGVGVMNTTVSLGVGGIATFVFAGIVNPFAASAGATTMTNRATVAAPADVLEIAANLADNEALDTDVLKPKANVSITKTDNVTSAVPGGGVTYSMVVTNAGPSAVVDAAFLDSLPSTLTNVEWTCAVSGSFNDCSVGSGTTSPILTLLDLAPSATATITVSARISPTARGTLSNTASITVPVGTLDPDTTQNSATDTDTLTPVVDVKVRKSHTGRLVPGLPATWTIDVSNEGPSSAIGTQVVDSLPASLSAASWTCVATAGSVCGTASGSGNIASLVDLAPSGSVSFALTATIDPSASGNLTNTASATVAGTETDSTPANNSSDDTDALHPDADLRITKVRSGPIVPGQPISYVVTVSNAGPSSAPNARVLDVMPAALKMPSTLTNPTWACATASLNASCGTASGTGDIDSLVTLPPGTTATFTIVADVPQTATGSIVNTAQVLPPAGVSDPDVLNNQASDTGIAQPRADLRITKTDSEVSSVPGEQISYSIVVTNDGPSAVPGATVIDNIPSALTGVTWTCVASAGSSCGTASGTGNISSQVSLVSGAKATFIVVATVSPTARGSLINSASVAVPATVIDPDSTNDSATDTNALTPTADLRVVKRHVGTFVPGASVQWIVEVTNLGPSSVNDATLNDSLPAAVSGVSWECEVTVSPLNACGATTGTGDVSTTLNLAVGSTATISIVGQLDAAARGNLSNSATVATPSSGVNTVIDPDPSNNSSTDVATLDPQADVRIVKSHIGALVPGTTAIYNIVVSNDGPSTVNGARVSDSLPPELSGATWTCVASPNSSCTTPSGNGNPETLVDLAVNGSVTIEVQALIAPDARGVLSNTATVAMPVGTKDPDLTDNRSTDEATLTPRANLSLVKSHTGPIIPGRNVTYTITVANAGPSDVVAAQVTDVLPSALTNAVWSCLAAPLATCATSGTGDLNTSVNIAAGGSVSFQLTATVDPTTTGSVANTASVTPPVDTIDPDTNNNTQTDSSAVVRTVDLVVSKRHSGDLIPGQSVTWQMTVANQGPSAVVGANVVDSLPGSVSNATWTCTTPSSAGNACGSAGSTGSINTTVDLLPGATAIFEVTADIDPAATGTLSNSISATVPSGVSEPAGGDNIATDTGPLRPIADLTISKSHFPLLIVPGQGVTYTIRVWNNGPSAVSNARVVDTFDANIVLPTWTCVGVAAGSGTPGSCDDASGSGNINSTVDLAPNSGATFTITADTNAASLSIENTATITPPTGVTDPDLDSNTANDPGTVLPTVDLGIAKTHTGLIVPGRTVTYSLVATNRGPSNVLGANVVDVLPAGLGLATWTCAATAPNVCLTASGSGSIDAAVDLVVNGSATFTLTGTVDPTFRGELANSASISAPLGTVELDADNNTSTDTASLAPIADLGVVKGNVGLFVPGSTAVYEIVITNAGPSSVSAAQVVDALPEGFSGASWTCIVSTPTTVSFAAAFTNRCLVGSGAAAPGLGDVSESVDLGVGASATITVTGTIDPSHRATATGGEMVNSATAILPAGTTDPNPLNNTGIDRTPLDPRVALTATKNHVGPLVPGEIAIYEIVITNAGPSTALNASVVDQLPLALSEATWTCDAAGGMCADSSGSGNIASTMTLLPGGSVTFVVRARIDSAARGSLVNTVAIVPTVDETDSTIGDDSPTDSGSLTPVANLSISKSHTGTIVPGTRATWTIVVTNAGPSDVVDAIVNDSLPTYLSAGVWTCAVPSGSANRCGTASGSGNLSTTVRLASGRSATFELSALVSSSMTGDVANTAAVLVPADTTDPDPSSNTATDTGVAVPTADLAITKSHTGAIIPGNSVTYTIVVLNNGPSRVTDAVVRDVLPSTLTNPRWTCTVPVGSLCADVSSVGQLDTKVTLESGAEATFTLTVDVDSTATANIVNRATVSAPAGLTDPQPANNSSTDGSALTPTADLIITKTHTKPLEANVANSYTITVTNNGPSFVRGATVTDVLPAILTAPTWTCVVTSGRSSGASCPSSGIGSPNLLVDLPSGGSVTITLAVMVGVLADGEITNEARVSLPSGIVDPDPSTNRAIDRAPVRPIPVLLPFDPPVKPLLPTTVPSTNGVTTVSPVGPVGPVSPVSPVDSSSSIATTSLVNPSAAGTGAKTAPVSSPGTDIGPASAQRELSLTGQNMFGLLVIAGGLFGLGSLLVTASRKARGKSKGESNGR